MATNVGTRSVSAQLTPNVADLVSLTDPGAGVSITNDTGGSLIWFTVSHPGGPCPVPTLSGVNSSCAASIPGSTVNLRHPGKAGSIVQLISSGAPTYTVTVTGNQINA